MTGKPWYEDDHWWASTEEILFDSDRVAASSDQVDLLLELTPLQPRARVLDLCCGIGRHSIELARRGFTVTGVDRTERYLERARNAAADAKVQVEWVLEDMRRYRRAGEFDLIINMFTSFGYFDDPEEDILVAQNMLASLKPGGRLVMETMGKEVLARIFLSRNWEYPDNNRDTIVLQEREVVGAWERMSNHWIILKDGRIEELTFDHRLFSAVELINLLKSAGFSDAAGYGSLDGCPYDHTAKRLVVVAEKQGKVKSH